MQVKKPMLLFAALILAVSLLCACDSGQGSTAQNNTEPVKLSPDLALADYNLVKVHFIDYSKLLLGYYRYGETAEDNAKLSVLGKDSSVIQPVYIGSLGDNAFYDVNIRDLGQKIVIHKSLKTRWHWC